jgi:hypothetical protein
MKQVYMLKVDPELRDLLPQLTKEEYENLEKLILTEGCRDSLVIWNNTIVDGHNRYNICQKHKIPFDTISLGFDKKSDVILWMFETQLGRRNLTPVQRIAIAEKYKEEIQKEAKENQFSGLKQNQNNNRSIHVDKTDKKINTQQELAKIAKVGSGTMARYDVVMKSGNEEIKKQMLNDEIAIASAYNLIKPKVNIKECEESKVTISEQIEEILTRICISCNQDKSINEFYGDDKKCKDCVRKESQTLQITQTKGSLKDVLTGENIHISEDQINSDGMKKAIEEVKISKVAIDYIDPSQEIIWLKNMCVDFIDKINSEYFTLMNAISKMDKSHMEDSIEILDQTINQINGIKIKINNKKEKIQ